MSPSGVRSSPGDVVLGVAELGYHAQSSTESFDVPAERIDTAGVDLAAFDLGDAVLAHAQLACDLDLGQGLAFAYFPEAIGACVLTHLLFQSVQFGWVNGAVP